MKLNDNDDDDDDDDQLLIMLLGQQISVYLFYEYLIKLWL